MGIKTCIFTIVTLVVFALPAIAGETDHAGCGDSKTTIYVDKMGIVNEEMLQEHIDKMQASLDQIKNKTARREEHRKGLRLHLMEMQQAMQKMHNMKLMSGCSEAAHGASVETQLKVLWKRMDMMQTMIEQILEHQKEAERE